MDNLGQGNIKLTGRAWCGHDMDKGDALWVKGDASAAEVLSPVTSLSVLNWAAAPQHTAPVIGNCINILKTSLKAVSLGVHQLKWDLLPDYWDVFWLLQTKFLNLRCFFVFCLLKCWAQQWYHSDIHYLLINHSVLLKAWFYLLKHQQMQHGNQNLTA